LGGADVEKQEDKSGEGEIGKKANVNKFGDFVDVVCYNYGTPGHHKARCKKPKTCFICKKENHVTDSCPIRKEGHMSAAYVGSAASGLGFYLIKVPEGGDRETMDFSNCGVVYIETDDISKEELQLELAICFNLNWPWQIRQLEE
jgi:hypothetical protein